MRFKLISLLLLIGFMAFGQKNLKDLTVDQIPVDMKYKGNLVSAVSYEDNLGLNYIIQAETGVITPKSAIEAAKQYDIVSVGEKVDTIRNIEADYRIMGLWVYHYVQKGDSTFLLWKNLDHIKDCSYKYITAEYLNKPVITDKDNNGVAETWLIYQLGCRDNKDAGMAMKLVMYQGDKYYVVRGLRQTKSEKSIKESASSFKADESYKELPREILDFAKSLWGQYILEK